MIFYILGVLVQEEKTMNLDLCMRRVEDAISYAETEGNITAYNWNEALAEKTVVAFGTGKFFEDTHERLFKMVDVQYLCDNNSEKWGKELYGRRCISPEQLKELDNIFVIIVMGDCRYVMKQLKEMGICSMHIGELHFSHYEKGKDCRWLRDAVPQIQKTLGLLADDRSRDIWTNVFCNKIYLSATDINYDKFAEGGEYFQNGYWSWSCVKI